VEATYRGPRLEGADENKVTREFVTEMMETFKNQKSIHTRYAFEILLQMKAILKATPTLMDIPVPDGTHFTVCGDVHGQVRCNTSPMKPATRQGPTLLNPARVPLTPTGDRWRGCCVVGRGGLMTVLRSDEHLRAQRDALRRQPVFVQR
jgi:hypothetical protein